MIFFLYHRKTRPTGQALAEALGITHHGTEISHSLSGRIDFLVRWGNRAPIFLAPGGVTIQRAEAIGNAANKFESLRVMQEAGVPVPHASTDPGELEYPFLGRSTGHARGTDVVLCLQQRDVQLFPRDYYVGYIPVAREFRVHVIDGEVARVQVKSISNIEAYRRTPWMRNHGSGCVFRTPSRRLNRSRLEAAQQAVQALGLDFGAVDLVVAEDGREYVLEVNTAPACAPRTAQAYAAHLARMIGERSNGDYTPILNMNVLEVLRDEEAQEA